MIDALLRKQVLIPSFVPTIDRALVTQVVSGDDGCCFAVKKDGIKEQINLAELKWMLIDNDQNYLNSPLQDAEYILYESSAQADNLVFTIANPYIRYDQEVLHFPCWQNDAVVYVLDATRLLSLDDRRYIERYLSDGSNRNLFFCINRMDNIKKKDVPVVRNFTKEVLKKFFMPNGVFDEALYQNRVFFISAYHSLNARLGKPSHSLSGDAGVTDTESGVPEFEYTLRKFLQQQSIEKQQAMEQRK